MTDPEMMNQPHPLSSLPESNNVQILDTPPEYAFFEKPRTGFSPATGKATQISH
jgi:hypothetical protein